jgi:uncharacterized protein DUF4157
MRALALQSVAPILPAKKHSRKNLPVPTARSLPQLISGNDRIYRKSACACGGGCPRCTQESDHQSLHTNLKISAPSDHFEREADRAADQVMHMTESHSYSGAREGAARQVTGAHSHVLSGLGQSLPDSERAFFEPRFGHDFGNVRIHTDANAAELAQSVNARAYTVGADVVFGAGEWSPGSTAGRRLLAHELAHVVQQAGGAPPAIRREPVNDLASDEGAVALEEPNKAPSCDDVCGNSAAKCVQEPGEHCSDDMSKKVMAAWTTAATQLSMAIDALAQSPLSATTIASLKANFNWSSGNSPTDLPTTVATNLSSASTKMSDNLCLKCLQECPTGGKAQIARARGENCLGSNCFRICPNFTADDTHVLLHELFHRVVTPVEDLYRGQSGYPPPPSIAVKTPDSYASLIDDVAPAAAAKKQAAKQTP